MSLEIQFEKHTKGSFKLYVHNLNMAHISASVADGYAMKADAMLQRVSYTLDNKMLFKKLKNIISNLLKKVDNLDDTKEADAYFNCVEQYGRIIEALSNKIVTPEDEVRLLSYIQNNLK